MRMPASTHYDADAAAIGAIRSGDRSAFETFVRRNTRWVQSVALGVLGDRDLCDDVCQQVWAAVWQRIGELRDARAWKSWIYRMARNAAIDAGRDSTRRKAAYLSPAVTNVRADALPPADAELVRAEQHREVLEAIQALPPIYREPFVMRHLNGWSYREIGDLMNMPVDSVETRLVRARRFLREALKRRLEQDGRAVRQA